MIGGLVEKRIHWLQALGISLSLHGVAAAAMLDVIPSMPLRENDRPSPQIEVAPLAVETAEVAPASLAPVQPVVPLTPEAVDPGSGQSGTDDEDETNGQVLTPADDLQAVTTTALGESAQNLSTTTPAGVEIAGRRPLGPGNGAISETAPAPGSPEAERNDALVELIGAIRERLAEPCLVALPQTVDGNQVQLTVLASDDRSIASVFGDLEVPANVPLAERSVLLDARQCPALAFARALPAYPVYPLTIQLEAREIASGDSLMVRVQGGEDAQHLSLVLIDDNGVVQDVTRFAVPSDADEMRLDIPASRQGGARDTSQLLMALASPEPLPTVSEQAGLLAEQFFASLEDDASPDLRIGLTTFLLR